MTTKCLGIRNSKFRIAIITILLFTSCFNKKGEPREYNNSITEYKKVNPAKKLLKKSSIKFYQSLYDFGNILINRDAGSVFYFVNKGKNPIQIQDVQTTCGCTIPSWPKEIIKPNERGEIKVIYDAKNKGFFKKGISIFYNGKDSPKTLIIKGNVVSKLTSNDRVHNAIRNSITKESLNPPTLESFTKPKKLIENLENTSSLKFNKWKLQEFIYNEKKWYSSTAVKQIGSVSKNGTQNDIGYEVFGKYQSSVNEIKINLNIKNNNERKEALFELVKFARQTFAGLSIKMPKNLDNKILEGKIYYFENNDCYILLTKEDNKEKNLAISKYSFIKLDKVIDVETFRLIIKSK